MPDRKIIFGCTEKAKKHVEVEQENGIEYYYYNCPLQFVTNNVWDFMKEYKYHKDFPSAGMPSFRNCNPRWILAVNYLETKISEYSRKD